MPFAIGKARRAGGEREGGFPGAEAILAQLAEGPARRLVGLKPEGRAPMRGGTKVFAPGGAEPVGMVTSGGFGPSVGAPVAMAYLPADHAEVGTRVEGEVRGKRHAAEVTALPFWKKGYAR